MNDISIGSRFLLSGNNMGIEWVVLSKAKEMCFIVPFDMNWWVGTWDVEIKELPDYGPAVLRCSRGIWFPENKLQQALIGPSLEDTYVQEAKLRLAALAGQDVPVVNHFEVDDDPDYQEWLQEIAAFAEQLLGEIHE